MFGLAASANQKHIYTFNGLNVILSRSEGSLILDAQEILRYGSG